MFRITFILLFIVVSCFSNPESKVSNSDTAKYKVLETISYGWNGEIFPNSENTYKAQNVHNNEIIPVFSSVFRKGKGSDIKYDCKHIFLEASYINGKDTIQNTPVTIDVVSFLTDDKDITAALKEMEEKGILSVNIISEAPVSCFTFCKDEKLIIVWHNIFAKEEIIKVIVDNYLKY